MASAPCGSTDPTADGSGRRHQRRQKVPRDEDKKKPVSSVYAQLLRPCNLATSSSESANSSNSSSSGSKDPSNDSRDEVDGTGSESADVFGEDGPAASTSKERVQNAAPPLPSSKQADGSTDDEDDADQEQLVASVVGKSSISLGLPVRVPCVTLVNKAEFLPEVDLVVSTQGRLMRPAPVVRFTNLHNDLQYVVWISFLEDTGVCAGEYMHPESPRPGAYLNGKLLSFSKLKLFAYNGASKKPVTLTCNKKHFIQLNFGNVNEHGHILKSTVTHQALLSTWFLAVNQYERISGAIKPEAKSCAQHTHAPKNKRHKSP